MVKPNKATSSGKGASTATTTKTDPSKPSKGATGSPSKGGAPQQKTKEEGVKHFGRSKIEDRPVLYPELDIRICHLGKALTAKMAIGLLEWEDEEDYTARMLKDHPKLKEAECKFGEEYTLTIDKRGTDDEGKETWRKVKVKCWNSAHNRPFTESWARHIAQDILNRNYAGPTTFPGETINGETIVIGRTGLVESGQHRLIALVLAYLMWNGDVKNNPGQRFHWQELWVPEEFPDGPILESLVVIGVSEAQNIIRTLDNVRPRDLGDVFYTSELFANLSSSERKICSDNLGACVKFLERRAISPVTNEYHRYTTNSEGTRFVEAHPHVLLAVEHIFRCNNAGEKGAEKREEPYKSIKRKKAITTAGLSAGDCAGVLYLMGSSSTDEDTADEYHAQEAPKEDSLSWKHWEKAKAFWTAFSKDELPALRKMLFDLSVGDDISADSNKLQKMALINKAWTAYLSKPAHSITEKDLELTLVPSSDGSNRIKKDELSNFGGIDFGETKTHDDDESPSQSEVEKAEKEERKKRATEARTKKLEEARAAKAAKKAKGTKDIMDLDVPPPGSPPVSRDEEDDEDEDMEEVRLADLEEEDMEEEARQEYQEEESVEQE